MINGKSVIGIIPARSGSKGLPGKNVRELCGKPLIAWSIDVARQSKYLDVILASTDSEEIAEVARQYGASVPFLRPPELASDTASSVDVIEHACHYYYENGQKFEYVVLIEPTSPLREASDIDRALEQMISSKADSVVSVCLAESTHPTFMFRLDDRKKLEPFQGQEFRPLRRQEIESVYFLEGTIYASSLQVLFEKRTFCHEKTVGYQVPKWKSLEIDDILDFMFVESVMKYKKVENGL